MLKIEKAVLPSPKQWEIIIEGTRNPMNSWHLMDSYATHIEDAETTQTADFEFFMGDNDHKTLCKLAKGGSVHGKYRRMIPVFLTINAPLYWWKEFDTYKIGTVANSCSTMHKIHAKEFTMDDFSCEHLNMNSKRLMEITVETMNMERENFIRANQALKTRDLTEAERKHITAQRKLFWLQMIQLLPTSYNQKRTVMLNYEVLHTIYRDRRNHKLDEWHTLCDWIKELPYAELITMEKEYD